MINIHVNYIGSMMPIMEAITKDKFASATALGVMLYIWSSRSKAMLNHKTWHLTEKDVVRHFAGTPTHRKDVESAFKELEFYKYLEKKPCPRDRKHPNGFRWVVYNEPFLLRNVTKLPY